MRQLSAETIGLSALAFLAAAPEEFQRFVDLSGLDSASVRARAGEPEFLAAVLDFLLGHEALLTRFCESEAIDPRPRHVHLASRALAGPTEE